MAAAAQQREAGQEAAPRPEAVALETAMPAGGTFFGVAVASMKLVLADGRSVKLDLPPPGEGRPTVERPLSPTQARIVECVTASPVALTRKQIAKTLGLNGTAGRFAIDCRELLELGALLERDGEYANDVTKFTDGV